MDGALLNPIKEDARMMGVSRRGPPDTLTPLFLHLLQPLGLQQPTKYLEVIRFRNKCKIVIFFPLKWAKTDLKLIRNDKV